MWRFIQKRKALWRSVIEVKYGSVRGGWCSLPAVGSSYGVSVWKYIQRGGILFLSSCDWRWEIDKQMQPSKDT